MRPSRSSCSLRRSAYCWSWEWRGQVPAALRLHDQVQSLRLDLNVRAARAALALLEPDRRDLALLSVAVCLAQDASREAFALSETPADAVRDVVLLTSEEVEHRRNGVAVQSQLGHGSQRIPSRRVNGLGADGHSGVAPEVVGRFLPLGVSTRVRPPSPAQKLDRHG